MNLDRTMTHTFESEEARKRYKIEQYYKFLEGKIIETPAFGFEISKEELLERYPILKPHQADIIVWALEGGRRAIFAQFGLGKTFMQLIIADVISRKHNKPFLIGIPLGVKQEFLDDAKTLGIDVEYVKDGLEAEEHHVINKYRLFLSNYERIRTGKFDPDSFCGVSFDEGDAIRNLSTETTDYILTNFSKLKYRFIATATPSPNDYTEILNYAQFLGVMDRSQALTRFFQRNSTTAGDLTLYPHKEKEFWFWVRSWAIIIQKPSDLGYSDEGYDLPALKVNYHEVYVKDRGIMIDRDRNVKMFSDPTKGLQQASIEKRESMPFRIAKVLELIHENLYIIDNEKQGTEKSLHDGISKNVCQEEINQGTAGSEECKKEAGLRNHSGAEKETSKGGNRLSIEESREENEQSPEENPRNDIGGLQHNSGSSGMGLCDLQNGETDQESEEALCGSLPSNRKNKGNTLPILQLWIGSLQRQCNEFIQSNRVPGQIIVWCHRNDEQKLIYDSLKKAGVSVASITGNDNLEEREQVLRDWKSKKYSILLSKPEILGSGTNLQQACIMIFSGIDYRFKDFIQSIHRIYRFGQKRQCEINILYSDAEDQILKTLLEKWGRHNEMITRMSEIIREYGLSSAKLVSELKRTIRVDRKEAEGEGWKAIHNDSVLETMAMPDNSLGMVMTSIPFSDQYEYCESYHDMGHNDGNGEFFQQMDFLTEELFRILQPGRIAAIHVKDRIRFSYQNGVGFTSLIDFAGQTVAHFEKHGFHLLGKHFITTDVVMENNQTYRLGWTEQCKDGSKMGAGSPEYLLVFRKAPTDKSNAYADVPVTKTKDQYTRARWQLDAHAYWKSSGNRLLNPDELRKMDLSDVLKSWKVFDTSRIYNHEEHVQVCEELDKVGKLPARFMAIPPQANDDHVWDDINRMNTLNTSQALRKKEKHVCPLQFDIIDRAITRYSNEGDNILDPFGGIMSVPYRCIGLKRYGVGVELNDQYWKDGQTYLREAEYKKSVPTLFDVLPDNNDKGCKCEGDEIGEERCEYCRKKSA